MNILNYLTTYICGVLILCSCNQTVNKTADEPILTETVNTESFQLSDSVLLLTHLDSLPKITFPFLSEVYNRSFPTIIDLTTFKDHKLFNLPFTRIPRSTETGTIDQEENDTTFNLIDNNYGAKWNLIAKTPKFILIEVYTGYAFLVTLTYDLKLIDAIRTGYADPAGNIHWHSNRHSIINKDLTVVLQNESELQVDDNDKYKTKTVEETWFVDIDGHIKQK